MGVLRGQRLPPNAHLQRNSDACPQLTPDRAAQTYLSKACVQSLPDESYLRLRPEWTELLQMIEWTTELTPDVKHA